MLVYTSTVSLSQDKAADVDPGYEFTWNDMRVISGLGATKDVDVIKDWNNTTVYYKEEGIDLYKVILDFSAIPGFSAFVQSEWSMFMGNDQWYCDVNMNGLTITLNIQDRYVQDNQVYQIVTTLERYSGPTIPGKNNPFTIQDAYLTVKFTPFSAPNTTQGTVYLQHNTSGYRLAFQINS